jgi:hypothetical protein
MEQKFEFTEGNYGMLDYKNEHTLKRYKELCKQRNEVDVKKYDCFFAFSNEQFAQGLKSIRPLREGEKLVSIGAGGYGTRDGAERLFKFYDAMNAQIKAECNPQEVYVYEYNNHECCIDWDGDLNAIRLIASIWGEDVARNIVRKSAFYPIEQLFSNKA